MIIIQKHSYTIITHLRVWSILPVILLSILEPKLISIKVNAEISLGPLYITIQWPTEAILPATVNPALIDNPTNSSPISYADRKWFEFSKRKALLTSFPFSMKPLMPSHTAVILSARTEQAQARPSPTHYQSFKDSGTSNYSTVRMLNLSF
jgi:hypothetical protein